MRNLIAMVVIIGLLTSGLGGAFYLGYTGIGLSNVGTASARSGSVNGPNFLGGGFGSGGK